MKNSSKLILASLKAGKEMEVSQRDFLLLSQYAESVGIELQIVNKKGLQLTIKMLKP